jgi:hypothetical protein
MNKVYFLVPVLIIITQGTFKPIFKLTDPEHRKIMRQEHEFR